MALARARLRLDRRAEGQPRRAAAEPELARSLPSVDQRALEFLSRDDAVAGKAVGARNVELLWEACKLPDYRRIARPSTRRSSPRSIRTSCGAATCRGLHGRTGASGGSAEGDIDTLSQRIAEIRTWTYISHRPGWLADPTHWQEKTKAIEDRLSDALHERLTKRFVDRRTSVLMRRLRESAFMEAEIGSDGTVRVEGHEVGELQGFRFTPDTKSDGPDAKAVRAAAQKALSGEYDKRAERFANAPNGDLAIGSDALVRWLGAPVASLASGDDPLKPRVVLLADEQLAGPRATRSPSGSSDSSPIRSRRCSSLWRTCARPRVSRAPRAASPIALRKFRALQRRDIAEEVRGLDQDARAALRRLGVRFGAYHIFVPALVKPAPAALMTLLWSIAMTGATSRASGGDAASSHGTHLGRARSDLRSGLLRPVGLPNARPPCRARRYPRASGRPDPPALAWTPNAAKRPDGAYNGREFIVTPAMMSILGATADDMDEILKGLGYRSHAVPQAEVEAEMRRQDEAQAARPPVRRRRLRMRQQPSRCPKPFRARTPTRRPNPSSPPLPRRCSTSLPPNYGRAARRRSRSRYGRCRSAAADAAPAAEGAAVAEPVKMVLLWKPSRGEGVGARRVRDVATDARRGGGREPAAARRLQASRPASADLRARAVAAASRGREGRGGRRAPVPAPRRRQARPGSSRRSRGCRRGTARRSRRTGPGRSPPFGKEREGSRPCRARRGPSGRTSRSIRFAFRQARRARTSWASRRAAAAWRQESSASISGCSSRASSSRGASPRSLRSPGPFASIGRRSPIPPGWSGRAMS